MLAKLLMLWYNHIAYRKIQAVVSMSFITFKDVKKSFGGEPVLNYVNFSLEKGGIYGFIGRNGSGKTVVFKLMSGLILPDSGTILYNGENLTRKRRFIDSMGVMIETPGFIPHYNGMKNLKILNSLSANPVKTEDICGFMTRLGLDPKYHRPVRTYSLGMRQKLGIIQAVMNKPELIILDEPMNSLDTTAADEVRKLFSEINKEGATIVMASHIAEDIESLCTRKFLIDNKTVRECE